MSQQQKKRKRLSGPEKLAIVKRYLVDRVPISDLCDEHGLQPSQIYRWQAALFEHGADVFDMKKGRQSSSTYRVLKGAGLLDRNKWAPSKKGTGFVQPLKAHEHWHVDISYLNVAGTFYFLCSVLDGYSRAIVHWEIRETMKEPEVERIIQRAMEKYPENKPRIISDNGPQFIAKDFKQFIRLAGITHVRTSPYYPQRNGKLERWHGTLKKEDFRHKAPQNLDDARSAVVSSDHTVVA